MSNKQVEYVYCTVLQQLFGLFHESPFLIRRVGIVDAAQSLPLKVPK